MTSPSDNNRPNRRPVAPFDLEAGVAYVDTADGSTFTPATVTPRGVAVVITDTAGATFRYGGLYRGIFLATGGVR